MKVFRTTEHIALEHAARGLGRTIVVGDVHGCIDELEALLAQLAPQPDDRLCFLGDLVDRGPDSVAVIRRVRALIAAHPASVCICGNHEEKALRFRERGRPLLPWAAAACSDDWAFLESLPLVHRLDAPRVVLVHGGFFPRFFEHYPALGEVPPDWRTRRDKRSERMRRFLRVRHVNAAGDIVALGSESSATEHWSARYDGREGFCFFGHDPQLDPPVPLRAPHALALDTGCCFGGRLTAAVLTGEPLVEIIQVEGRRHAEPLALDDG